MIPAIADTQKRVCIINDSGKKYCGRLLESNGEKTAGLSGSLVAVSYPSADISMNFKLLKCYRSSIYVSCKFTVVKTEPEKDNYVSFYAANGIDTSQATDSQGERYVPIQVTDAREYSKQILTVKMIKNKPVNVYLSFDIPPATTIIKTLTLLTVAGGGDRQPVRFSNVKIYPRP